MMEDTLQTKLCIALMAVLLGCVMVSAFVIGVLAFCQVIRL